MVRSSSWPFEPPHRRREVLHLQRLHDLADADARRPAGLAARISTVISRSIAADHVALSATPVNAAQLARDGRDRPRRVSSAPVIVFDDSASETIGKSAGSKLGEDRLLHLRRQVVADRGDLVADLLRGFLQVLLEVELRDDDRRSRRASSTGSCRRR